MSLVFLNIDPSPPGECVLPPNKGGGTHSPGGEGGGGSIFWKTRDIGLPSYSTSNNRGQLITEPLDLATDPDPQHCLLEDRQNYRGDTP